MIKKLLNEYNFFYWCLCDEIGENGTYHTHLFIAFHNAISFDSLQKKFPGFHFEVANGTSQQNRDYIRKENKWEKDKKKETNLIDTFEEFGEMPVERQGVRNDIADLYSMIKQGMDNFSIMESDPKYMMALDKIERARQTIRENEFKNKWRELNVEYIYGDTGTGKTRSVMEKYGYENVYRITDYDHPFDGYKGQDVIIFEEFRSSLKIQDMLNYLDGYPLELPCRYSNKIACFTKVFIISNLSLHEQYSSVQLEYPSTWNAFKRRIHNVIYKKVDTIQQEYTEQTIPF